MAAICPRGSWYRGWSGSSSVNRGAPQRRGAEPQWRLRASGRFRRRNHARPMDCVVARSRISQPISALARAAPALGRGEAMALPAAGYVDEVNELARALGESAVAVRDRRRTATPSGTSTARSGSCKGRVPRNAGSRAARSARVIVPMRPSSWNWRTGQPQVLDNVSAILGRQVEQMTRLVDDLLEVGRVTGEVQLQREPLDFSVTLLQLMSTWRNDKESFCITTSAPSCSQYGCPLTVHASNRCSRSAR